VRQLQLVTAIKRRKLQDMVDAALSLENGYQNRRVQYVVGMMELFQSSVLEDHGTNDIY